MAVARNKPTKLVFYDLEWSSNEIIQIGAVCGTADFSQCIRPSGKIDPFVKKKIKLDVRKDPAGHWQVFDLMRKRFLPTVNPREGFDKFLSWLEDVGEGSDLMMISHGNADILVLDRNLARYDLDNRLYSIVSKYVDFQKYLAVNFKDISHLSLLELVKIFCNDQIFRLHCADEDSKALMSVFTNMHQMRGVSSSDYMKNLDKLKKVYIKSVTIPKNSKEIKDIANQLNPGSKYVLLPSIFGVYNNFVSSPLFTIIEHPENFKFEVSGYCVSHRSEKFATRNYSSKKEDEYKERTRVELACHIGNAYFILVHYIPSGAKSPFNLVRKEGAHNHKRIVLSSGSPVSVMILVTSTNYVKVDDISVNYEKKLVDINRILTDLQKKQSNSKDCNNSWGSLTSSNSEASTKSPPAHNNVTPSGGHHNKNSKYFSGRPAGNMVVEVETDTTILTRRQKQIEYCKRTDDYKAYIKEVPKQSRGQSMPKTPDMNRKYSRRQWDGAVKVDIFLQAIYDLPFSFFKRWKTQVHACGRDIAKTQSSSNNSDNSCRDHPQTSKENANPNTNQ